MSRLLILDIDETLVYATPYPLDYQEAFTVGKYFVYKRPYVEEFVDWCSQRLRLAIWTASQAPYAALIIERLFPGIPFEFVWTRDDCSRQADEGGLYFEIKKDLEQVELLGFELEQVWMVDNSPDRFMNHYRSLIPISSFTGDPADGELLRLMKDLELWLKWESPSGW